jgi:5'-nucleotidase (lipoprotein e(P4) family)
MNSYYRHIATVLLMIALSGGCASTRAPSASVAPGASGASTAAAGVRDAHEGLNGVLWTQTSGEFWAMASGTYNSAQIMLDRAISEKSWSAALEQTAGYENLSPAVILDLDETVLDNSPAQAQIVLERTTYQQELWVAWVGKIAAAAIPGAQSFIAFAEKKGVKVFFITNRAAAEQDDTLENLAALGIAASDQTVLCPGENGWTSDKTARRAEVARSYRVLLLVGDDMNDFVATATLSPPERVALAKKHSDRWGRNWILLPNPLYGSWERALYAGLTRDEEILQRKREQLKGFRP